MDNPLIWVEVDLNAIAENVRELRRVTEPGARLMAVVKANGYGHGAVEVAQCALRNGAELLGVARIEEGIQLRNAGIDVPILIFSYTPPSSTGRLLKFDLAQTVFSHETAEALSEAAISEGKRLRVHIKVDTGMGRLGLLPEGLLAGVPGTAQEGESAVQEALSISRLQGLNSEGIFTHFAAADSADKSYARRQLEIFLDYTDRLRREGLDFPIRHAANSAALIDLPESHLDLVRPGIALYGLAPSQEVERDRVLLRPAMTLKTKIIQLKKVPAEFAVSYGMTYKTPKPTTIATLPAGYADGLNRLLSSRGEMLVRGQRVPIIGRICMDLCMLDVGDLTELHLEDEVVVFGRQGDETITVDEIAASLNSINYEVVSTIMNRVPRVYSGY